MSEHKHNKIAKYFKKHSRAKTLPRSLQNVERRPRTEPVKLPEGRYIINNSIPVPGTCPRCQGPLTILEEDKAVGEEDEDCA